MTDSQVTPPGTSHDVRRRQFVETSARIVRACVRCEGLRDADNPSAPCASCGNPDPAVVVDLGLVNASYASLRRRVSWALLGLPMAHLRAAVANARHARTPRS